MSKPFTFTRRVRFAETDMARIVHFSAFFRYMEEAETEFWRSLGLSMILSESGLEIGWPKVRAVCDYRRPLKFDDPMEIDLTVAEIGTRSLRFAFVFRRPEGSGEDGKDEVARGEVTVVCLALNSPDQPRAMVIPDAIRAKLEAARDGV
jgi:acyl-CoA thioester hydrolase